MLSSSPGRDSLLGLLALAAAACGGDSSTNPDPGGDPASVAIHVGNNQSAAVGTAVAVDPAVVVKDADGNTLQGVRVSFAVESGGGSVVSATASTSQNGVASSGRWTLGPTSGAQTLSATVAGLPKVTFSATATSGGGSGQEILTQTITTGGGTISINRPGSQLNGVRLQFDAGALGAAAVVTITEESLAGYNLSAGMTALTPGIGVSSTAGRLDAGVSIRFPATPQTGKILMVGYADPVSKRVTAIPTLKQDATSITALVPSLDASGTAGVQIAGSLMSGSRMDEPKSLMFLLAINEELLNRDFDTGFRPGADDWDFPRMAIADLAFLKRPGQASMPFAAVDDGMVTTSLWYFVNRRAASGSLHGSMQLLPQQPLSSRYGIRWAALAEKDVPPISQTGGLLIREWNDWATDDRGRFQWLQFQGIKAMMLTTFNRPVPVVLLETDNPDEFNSEAHPMAIAYRTAGNTLYLAWPGSPGSEIQVQFSEQGMTPFLLPNQNGTANMVRAIGGIHYVNVIDDSKLAAQWTRVANRTIGDAEGWPTPKFHWEKAELDTARVFLLDTLQMWWQCSQCPSRVSRPAQLPQSASNVQRFRGVRNLGAGGSPNLSASFSSIRLSADGVFEGEQRLNRHGFLVQHPVEEDGFVGIAIGWLDWQTVVFRKLELEPSVPAIEFSQDTTVTVVVTPSETPPSGTRYRWLLRTSDSQDSVETTVPTHTRDLEAGTDGWLIFSALEGEHRRPVARDSIRIESGGPVPYWRLTAVSDADELLDDDEVEGSGEVYMMLQRMVAAPGSAIISIEDGPDGKTLYLRVRRSGTWPDGAPGPFNGSSEWRMVLGPGAPQTYPLGPYFSAWRPGSWSQTTSDLSSGNVLGQNILGMASYNVHNAGTQTGPAGGVRINATRNGTVMSGALEFWIWFVDYDDDIVGQAEGYPFPFTAVRMQ